MNAEEQSALASSDRERQVFVTLALVFSLAGASLGFGLFGTPVRNAAGGVFGADGTYLAPAPPAFVIWRVLWVGTLCYTAWQWLPSQRTSARQRRVGWLAGWSMILAGGWLLVTQRGWLWLSAVFLAGITVVLGLLIDRVARHGSGVRRWPGALLLDCTFGAYLGWACVALCANIAVALHSMHISFGADADPWVAALVIGAVALVGVALAVHTAGRWSIALALAWGFGWIAWGRIVGELRSPVVAVAAAAAAVVVLAATAVEWRAGRRAAN